MVGIEHRSVCEGVNFRSIRDTKFKTIRMSAHLMLPLSRENAARNALLPFLMARASKDYPDFTKLSQRLAELYGASLGGDVSKLGDVQVLSLSVSGIADRYALEGEHIAGELAGLLRGVIFDPPFEADGLFPEEGFQQEKRQAMEMVDAEFNDKRVYARQRCEALMCAEEPFGVDRLGGKDALSGLNREEMTQAWKSALQDARIEIMVLGDCQPEGVFEAFCKAFEGFSRAEVQECPNIVVRKAEKVNDVTEKMELAQSKLVLGFRTGTALRDAENPATKLMCAVFGGTPNAKLFLNVREKMSLCYYCSSQYNSMKGIMMVQSGVETANVDKAREEILRQLEEVRQGNVTGEEISAAKLSLVNALGTVTDSLGAMEGWYLSQVFSNRVQTPEEAAAQLNAVTKEELVAAANRVTLDTVYRLIGNGGEAE